MDRSALTAAHHRRIPALLAVAWAIYALVIAVILFALLYIARDFIAHQTGQAFLGAKPPTSSIEEIDAYLVAEAVRGVLKQWTDSSARSSSWIRAGYPEGIPATDTFPVLALLTRRLSNDEVKAVTHELMQRGDFDNVDIGVLITQLTDELPTPEDIERVRARLAAKGWPFDEPHDSRGPRIAVLRALGVPSGSAVPLLLPALERVLAGRDPALVAVPADGDHEPELRALRVGSEIDDDVALVATTSGTTGAPKGALLTAAALTASASATHDRLGGPGSWLLALPPHHIAGLQVLVRSVLAGSVPVELDVTMRPGGSISPNCPAR